MKDLDDTVPFDFVGKQFLTYFQKAVGSLMFSCSSLVLFYHSVAEESSKQNTCIKNFNKGPPEIIILEVSRLIQAIKDELKESSLVKI